MLPPFVRLIRFKIFFSATTKRNEHRQRGHRESKYITEKHITVEVNGVAKITNNFINEGQAGIFKLFTTF